MAIKVRREGALRTATRLRVMQGNTLRDIRTVKVLQGDVLREVASFFTSLTATADFDFFAQGYAEIPGPVFVESNEVTITPSGGSAPYTYAWTQTSGAVVTIFNGSTARAYFTATRNIGTTTGALQCVVTDSLGATATVAVPFQIDVGFNA